ncbi:MAG: type II secretion system minor pseudopilin GspI, partial [Arenimonas sp.]|uniref:type II secretion system minor pseudopilin GspI n=1 Tax=Arenimonas sp. TaxID=1872635 RepID=UPI0025C4ABF8
FTLIEMLVALSVFSLAVLALLNLSGENARTATLVHEQVLAGVVADNRAVEALLMPMADLAAANVGVEEAGGAPWRWSRTLADTSDPAIVRVDVQVRHPDAPQVLAHLSVFRSRQ